MVYHLILFEIIFFRSTFLFFVGTVTLEELCENVEQTEKYDAVIASELIEHITDVDSFIGNMAKLLKV